MMMTSFIYFIFITVFNIKCIIATHEDIVVHIKNGAIQGRKLLSQKGLPFYAFQEVPYATPPIGKLRFQEPVPPKNWNGILNTTRNTKICYQDEATNYTKENEDCLYLNVYTPIKPCKHIHKKLPILVYIHGGGFARGDGTYESYGPEFWMDYGIIIVTMNYRLGPFGFLTTEDRVIPANNGLKDQNMALQWIQINIEKFGGDPSKVTISGQSSGGASADFHMLSRRSKGLMRAAILQSGNCLDSYVVNHNARDYAYRLANMIDKTITPDISNEDLLKFLQSVPAKTIQNNVIPEESYIGAEGVWVAAFEDPKYNESFLVSKMHESYKNGKFNKIPTMVGFTSEEMINYVEYDFADFKSELIRYDNNFSLFVNQHYNIDPSNITAVGLALRNIYTNGRFQDDIGNSVRFMSDAVGTTPMAERVVLQSKYSPVYFYQFSYSGKLGGIHKYIPGVGGIVGHTDDLKYMWRTDENANLHRYPQSDIISQTKLLTLWSNFVKYLNPTPRRIQLFNYVIWPTMSEQNFVYVNISNIIQTEKDPKEYKKWKQIINTYGNPPFETY